MAGGTVRGKHSGLMVRICGAVEICTVAPEACIGCIVVVAVVTGSTVIGYSGMSSRYDIIIVVVGKGGRTPPRCRGMARIAICRQTKRRVVWIDGLIKILDVTRRTVIGRTLESAGVALQTGQAIMGPCQDKTGCIMVKDHICLSCGMAGKTGRRTVHITAHTIMLLVGLWILVTGSAGKHSVIVGVNMTVQALGPLIFMFA